MDPRISLYVFKIPFLQLMEISPSLMCLILKFGLWEMFFSWCDLVSKWNETSSALHVVFERWSQMFYHTRDIDPQKHLFMLNIRQEFQTLYDDRLKQHDNPKNTWNKITILDQNEMKI